MSFFFAVKTVADEPSTNATVSWVFTATNHLGQWIWDTNTFDKQTVRFLKTFEISAGEKVFRATLHITVDNGYTLFIDGEEIGRGSDWRTVTEYDVTQLMRPGRHVIGVEGFNDRLEGGLVFGLHLELASQEVMDIASDNTWSAGPGDGKKWSGSKLNAATMRPAVVIGPMLTHPWEVWPYGLATVPPIHPVVVHFWQRGWFQLLLFCTAAAALLFSVWLMTQLSAQAKAQNFLRVERVRIARDIHDGLGAQLTQLLLLGEVAQREQPDESPARTQFTQICDHARELAHAIDEVVWAVNSRRDTVRDFTSYVCKYAQNFLSPMNIRCRLDVEPEILPTAFDLPVRRNLLLAVKEALNNAAKHSQADELFLRIYLREHKLSVVVEDNGRGFDPAETGGERNGMTNMAQRMADIGGTCEIQSQPGGGCLVMFTVALPPERRRWFRRARHDGPPNKIEISNPGS
ncbi:MAG: ATP-binding protein [Verrucomicrobia bacterium]|nr:ATP-binding protein [Verrucomicrobiota bacterium]